MAVNSSDFELIAMQVATDTNRKVDHIDVEIISQDCQGTAYFTDVMFQSGTAATTWVGHVSEIKWSFDNA